MAYTQNDADELKAAIKLGASRVRYSDGKEVEYRSLQSMQDTLRIIEAEISGESSTGAVAGRSNYGSYSKD